MRLYVIAVAVFAAVTSAAAMSVNTSDIPTCAIPCLVKTLKVINCTAIDEACMCSNSKAMSQDMMPCLLRSCTMEETLKMSKTHAIMCNHPAESRQRFLRDMTIGCFVVQLCFILMKFFTRGWIQRQLWADDWILLVGFVSPLVGSAILFWSIELGLGTHMWQVRAQDVTKILGGFLISEASYPWTLGLVRISLLVFLLQTFPDRRFQLTVKILIVYTSLHTVSFFIAVILQCAPIAYAWDKTLEGKCVDLTALTYAAAVMSGVLDIATVVLPINELRKLQMSLNKKIGVIIIFIIGSCGCIAGFIRVKEIGTFSNDIGQDPDITWDYVNITYWTEIEITAMILCTCIPSLRPLVLRAVSASLKDFPSKMASYWSLTSGGGTKNSVKAPSVAMSEEQQPFPLASLQSNSPGDGSRGATRTESSHNYDDAKWLAFPRPESAKEHSSV